MFHIQDKEYILDELSEIMAERGVANPVLLQKKNITNMNVDSLVRQYAWQGQKGKDIDVQSKS